MTFLCLYEIANFIVLYRYSSSEYISYLLPKCIQSNFLSALPYHCIAVVHTIDIAALL
jgi:hypothetical protein